MSRELSVFDRHELEFMRYHNRLLRLCQALCAIHDDGRMFNKIAPKDVRKLKDNQQIRWRMEDKIRTLLRKRGDYPPAILSDHYKAKIRKVVRERHVKQGTDEVSHDR